MRILEGLLNDPQLKVAGDEKCPGEKRMGAITITMLNAAGGVTRWTKRSACTTVIRRAWKTF